MVSNYKCTANRKTYSQEANRGHGGLLRLITTHLLLYPPASLIFLLFASLATDVRRPCPPINNVGRCSEELIEELIFERYR